MNESGIKLKLLLGGFMIFALSFCFLCNVVLGVATADYNLRERAAVCENSAEPIACLDQVVSQAGQVNFTNIASIYIIVVSLSAIFGWLWLIVTDFKPIHINWFGSSKR